MKIKTQEVKKKVLKSLKSKLKDKKAVTEESPLSYLLQDDPEDDIDDNESLDSDQELQLAFARKELTPGLNIELPKQKEFKNDKDGLERKLKSIFLNMDWVERLDVTISKEALSKLEQKFNDLQKADANGAPDLANNDFKRESLFLKQAELAVVSSLPKLDKLSIRTKRPEDYFAEMAKSDDHMKRVREHLLSKHAEMEKRDKIRKLRELKKMGKQVQIEAQKKKEQAKKKLNEKVKKFKKGDKKENLDILLDEDDDDRKGKKRRADSERDDSTENSKNGSMKKPSKKAKIKDQKYGFGGRKKRSKYNTAESYAEAFQKKGPKGSKDGKRNFGKNKPKKFMNKNKPKK